MNRTRVFAVIASTALLFTITALVVAAEATNDAKSAPAAAGAQAASPKLPPGWTEADMQAVMAAGTPGKQHERLAQAVGVWQGKGKMWMAPDAEAIVTDCTATTTALMGGHYIKTDMTGEMPGMGPFVGQGIYGFDNVSQQFVANWIDSFSTGMMNATGELSPDGKVLTWHYTFNCPITKKVMVIREIETITGPNTKLLESWGTDPKSGKEFKNMSIEFTKKN